jgi:tetratricopeptide (TPR) repeat protein
MENSNMRRFLVSIVLPPLAAAFVAMALKAQTHAAHSKKAADSTQFQHFTPPAWKSVEIGNFYLHRKDYPGALSRFEEATHTDPDYAPAYLGLGKVCEKLGQKQEALTFYQKYLDELPSEKQAREAADVHKAIRLLEGELGLKERSSLSPAKSRAEKR